MTNKRVFHLGNGFSLVLEGEWYNFFKGEGSIIETNEVSLYVEKNHNKTEKPAKDDQQDYFKKKNIKRRCD